MYVRVVFEFEVPEEDEDLALRMIRQGRVEPTEIEFEEE